MNDQDSRVLAVIALEANGHSPKLPFAGLKLTAWRASRARLVEQGLVACDDRGRYVPADVARERNEFARALKEEVA